MTLSKDRIPYAAGVLARAFHNDSIIKWIIPNESDRSKKLPILFQSSLKYGYRYGMNYTNSTDVEAVSIWFGPHNTTISLYGILYAGIIQTISAIGVTSAKK